MVDRGIRWDMSKATPWLATGAKPEKTERDDPQPLHRQRAPGREGPLRGFMFEFAQPEAPFAGACAGRVRVFFGCTSVTRAATCGGPGTQPPD